MTFKVKRFSELTSTEVYGILRARAEVFVKEQGIRCVDPDNADFSAIHMFLEEDGKIIAYLRVLPDSGNKGTVKIGRVLTLTHGEGHGRILLEKAMLELKIKFNIKKITLHSQKTAVGFYKKLGFEFCSDEFLEEGIWHISMEKNL